jgi:sugar-specific transcriptional regulator TrmB
MADDSEFITKLIGFGLSEKEAQLYLHLLKYGSKSPSLLAKSLKTYREDVHRTLTGLIDKGMVNPSLETPTVYAAVELDIALEAALRKHETELREMEVRKQELQELSQQQHFRPSDEFATFKILKRVGDVLTMALSTLNSAEKEWVAVIPTIATVFSSLYNLEDDKKFIDRGGTIRFITDITYPYVELIQQHLDMGMEVHHFDKYAGLLFFVFDKKISVSGINVDVKRVSLNEPLSVLWTDDLTYAQYLVSTFEMLWEQAVPAAQRIEELLKEGPPGI